MIKPADSDEEKEEDSDKAVAVKDDPQFTIAVTRGELCLLPRPGREIFFPSASVASSYCSSQNVSNHVNATPLTVFVRSF